MSLLTASMESMTTLIDRSWKMNIKSVPCFVLNYCEFDVIQELQRWILSLQDWKTSTTVDRSRYWMKNSTFPNHWPVPVNEQILDFPRRQIANIKAFVQVRRLALRKTNQWHHTKRSFKISIKNTDTMNWMEQSADFLLPPLYIVLHLHLNRDPYPLSI